MHKNAQSLGNDMLLASLPNEAICRDSHSVYKQLHEIASGDSPHFRPPAPVRHAKKCNKPPARARPGAERHGSGSDSLVCPGAGSSRRNTFPDAQRCTTASTSSLPPGLTERNHLLLSNHTTYSYLHALQRSHSGVPHARARMHKNAQTAACRNWHSSRHQDRTVSRRY